MSKLFNKIKHLRTLHHQRGAVLMIMLVILVVGGIAMLLSTLTSTSLRLERDSKTAEALAQAKEALIGYASTQKLTSTTYPDRPGDLPCPDNHPLGDANEGSPSTPCSSNAIGRLPWKKLGLPDLRDSSGERLWYAVSTNFKDAPRIGMLNSDTLGTISVFSSEGVLLNDGGGSTGAVAVIIAPGEVLTRQGSSTAQDRSSAGYNIATNYLDTPSAGVNPKDNASFVDGSSTDGFIQGQVKIYDPASQTYHTIINDQLLVITHNNLMQFLQKRVAKEVVNALNFYYSSHYFYPRPADFTDSSCLGNGNLASCNSASITGGRIPATPVTAWDITSILRGSTSNNWFQANGWREVIFYAVASACTDGTTNCNGTGYLTLNNPPGSPYTTQKVVVIATGTALSGQSHSMVSPKNILSNYLEDENLAPQDDIYTKSAAPPFNDIAISIP
jgi:type II secretory pathway pseudopilin PulG